MKELSVVSEQLLINYFYLKMYKLLYKGYTLCTVYIVEQEALTKTE